MIYNKICLMLPTYKRSETSLPVFIDSAIEMANNPAALRFSFCVNKKDFDTFGFIINYAWPEGVEYEIIQEDSIQPNLAKYFNLLYDNTKFNNPDTIVSMVGDDMEFKTKGWDLELLNLIQSYNGVGVFWCNDDYIAHENLCVNLFVTRKFVEATRKPFMCDLYHADMIDLVWMRIGVLTNTCHYLPEVIIKHNHSTSKPQAEWDSTFRRLKPIQEAANSKMNHTLCEIYANIVSGILIMQGYGSWTK